MQDIIHLLPESVTNQIAAGEVISRPSNVIKELVENAVDAGADNIQVIVRDGGKALIQVVDNGKGMSTTDARLAFERGATSKISCPEDLFNLHTMGFRGEALPSICAISQIEMHTRRPDDELGTRLLINGSQFQSQEACTCPSGTNIMVKNLFFNVPARRRFLKSEKVEQRHILREFERLALVNHDKKMSLDQGSRPISLEPGSFAERIYALWKDASDRELLPIEIDSPLVRISGFIGKPRNAKKLNARQFFIVNGRNMRHPMFHKAVVKNYEELVAPGGQPCYYIRFDINPSAIDVNVHPTKHEIKFQDENAIFSLLDSAVRNVLRMVGEAPGITFDADYLPVNPVADGNYAPPPDMGINPHYNPFDAQRRASSRKFSPASDTRIGTKWEELYEQFEKRPAAGIDTATPEVRQETVMTDNSIDPICFQGAKKYIILKSTDGIYVIDQHRAHVNILFHQLMAAHTPGGLESQGVMLMEPVGLDNVEQEALTAYEDELERLGFRLEYIEENKWKICGVPALIGTADAHGLLHDMLTISDYDVRTPGDAYDRLFSNLCLGVAKARAYRGGDTLSQAEMEALVVELFNLRNSETTPTGLPVYVKISFDNIGKMFQA